MFKVDKLKSSLNCDGCHKLLVDPVVMPCDNIICKAHLDKLLRELPNEKNTFTCVICLEEHLIPNNGFVISSRLQDLLGLELNQFEPSPMFEECKNELRDARKTMLNIEHLESNAESYIYDYYEDIKRQVYLRSEDLKQRIDDYSDDMIKSLEINQTMCIKVSKEVNQIADDIEKSKNELNDLMILFDSLVFNDKKFEEIKTRAAVVKEEFYKMLGQYQDSLVGDKKYTFQFIDLSTEDIFGRLSDYPLSWPSKYFIVLFNCYQVKFDIFVNKA